LDNGQITIDFQAMREDIQEMIKGE